ncbi:cation/acetate symporter [Panacagrimonas perspica]|uniref:Cation/acetate symporter n=1 Tax=Panacagrimonas perspica TaxID=381431 RepID=A0A4R7P596_9GAMM|nr:cation/acetate symporter ActP [Panacagrimonas perspica]TDU28907.1 cation/acetate symporter [Panacagrimonas perspica]THD02268.1 cation acetate symporter [Panacagrimonas perspica]
MVRLLKRAGIPATLLVSAPAATGADVAARAGGHGLSVAIFLCVILATVGITAWAARRTNTREDLYAAGGGIGGVKNGLALAGDYMSAAAFLGISSMIYSVGFDGLAYAVGFVVGWPIIMFLIAERLRRLGRFTFTDVLGYRLSEKPVRILGASSSLVTIAFYLIAQMVGAGQLVRLLFGLPYEVAIVLVGVLMTAYVAFGGMLATTWVQIVKAVLLLGGASTMALLVLARFGFSYDALIDSAVGIHKAGDAILTAGPMLKDPLNAISLGIALMFGTAGLPHILMRFFTVNNVFEARKSIVIAVSLFALFVVLIFTIGYGAVTLLPGDARYVGAEGVVGGNNMVAMHVADAVGGSAFMGFMAAVAFATILAVVAGLTLSGATAISHDLYASVFRKDRTVERDELLIFKSATVGIGLVAIALGLLFKDQNVAFMVGLAFAIAASANFPVLLLAMSWRGLTTRGALVGGSVGLGSAVALTVAGPTVWVKTLGNAAPLFPLDSPAIVSMSLGFLGCWLASVTDRSARGDADRTGFDRMIGSASGPSSAR